MMSAALLQSPHLDEVIDSCSMVSTSYLASQLEQTYALHLASELGEDGLGREGDDGGHEESAPTIVMASEPTTSGDGASECCLGADGKSSIGAVAEANAARQLEQRLPRIIEAAGCAASQAILWGVDLTSSSPSRSSLLSAFLRAREWDVDRAEPFLVETLSWRREHAINANGMSTQLADDTPWGFPDDAIVHAHTAGADGQPRTYVVIRLGKVPLQGLQAVDAFVAWRIRMQERACRRLADSDAWAGAPRGPTYTLVLDCSGMRPYHFGRASRRALGALTHVLTHYYPDFVTDILVLNTPSFVSAVWGVVSRLTPAWWGLSLLDAKALAELEHREGACLLTAA